MARLGDQTALPQPRAERGPASIRANARPARFHVKYEVADGVSSARTAEPFWWSTVRNSRLLTRETLPESAINLCTQSRTVCWSCPLAAAGEAPERVRLGVGRARVGAGRCCSPNGAENDSSADKQFRHHFQGSFHFSSLAKTADYSPFQCVDGLSRHLMQQHCCAWPACLSAAWPLHRVNHGLPIRGHRRRPPDGG